MMPTYGHRNHKMCSSKLIIGSIIFCTILIAVALAMHYTKVYELQSKCTGSNCMFAGKNISSICKENANCNNGKCILSRCVCPVGFTGDWCQNPTNCSSVTCAKGEECVHSKTGPVCEAPNLCTKHCLNGGKCVRHRNTSNCLCSNGFGGVNCQYVLQQTRCPNITENAELQELNGTWYLQLYPNNGYNCKESCTKMTWTSLSPNATLLAWSYVLNTHCEEKPFSNMTSEEIIIAKEGKNSSISGNYKSMDRFINSTLSLGTSVLGKDKEFPVLVLTICSLEDMQYGAFVFSKTRTWNKTDSLDFLSLNNLHDVNQSECE